MLDITRLVAALVAAYLLVGKLRGDITNLKARIAVLETQVDPDAQSKVDGAADQAEAIVAEMQILDAETADVPPPV